MRTFFKSKHLIQKITMLLIMFIDGLGMSLVIPLFGQLFSDGAHSMLESTASKQIIGFYYSASLVFFSGMMVFGASILGQLSDAVGRRLTLRVSLVGSLIGYIICAVAELLKMPVCFSIGRALDGLTAGSIPIAQAIMTDLDSEDNTMTSIGLVMFAVTAGYMFGPMFAGIAFIGAQHNLVMPFLLIACFCMISLWLLRTVPHTNESSNNKKISVNLFNVFNQIGCFISRKSIRIYLLGFLLFQTAWALLYQYMPMVSIAGDQLSGAQSSFLMGLVGLVMCLGFCIIVPKLQGKMRPKNLVCVCLASFVFISGLYLVKPLSLSLFYLVSAVLALLYTVVYSSMLAYLLSISDTQQSGLVLGSVASICATAATISAVLGASVVLLNATVFFCLILLMVLVSLLLFVFRGVSFATIFSIK